MTTETQYNLAKYRYYDPTELCCPLARIEAAEIIADIERQRAELARQEAKAERLQKEKLLAKLREPGINPDE